MNKNVKRVFGISLFIAFILEITLMNYGFYYSLFAKKEISWNDAQALCLEKTQNGFVKDNETDFPAVVTFKNINIPIHSIFVDFEFDKKFVAKSYTAQINNGPHKNALMHTYSADGGGYSADFLVEYNDDDSKRYAAGKWIKYLSHTNYFTLFPSGKVSQISIIWNNKNIAIKNIVLNKTIPINISLLRLFLLFLLFLTIGVFKNKQLAQKAKFFLYELKFDEQNIIQKRIYFAAIIILVLFCFFTAYMAYQFGVVADQYNYFMPKAFLNGQLHLPIEPSQNLLDAKRPLDPIYRAENDIVYHWDNVFYNSKYYSYYGVVPVFTLFLPYFVLSGGNILATSFGVFVFAALSCVFLMILWKEIVRRYMKNMPFFFFLISGITLVSISGLFLISRRPMFYEVAEASGLCFSVLGLFLLLKSIKNKINFTLLFFACLSFALAVGCRPTTIFCSLFVPILLWKTFIAEKNKLKIIIPVIIPYLTIGIPIALYNYFRFGSISDFGVMYSLTICNTIAYHDLNFIAKSIRTLNYLQQYIFEPLQYNSTFPFLDVRQEKIHYNGYLINFGAVGLINLPIIWFLLKYKKAYSQLKGEFAELKNIFVSSSFISLIALFFIAYMIGIHHRYSVDFMYLITIPALICAYLTYENVEENKKIFTLKIIYFACFVSLFVGMSLSFAFENDPYSNCWAPVFYYIQRALSIG